MADTEDFERRMAVNRPSSLPPFVLALICFALSAPKPISPVWRRLGHCASPSTPPQTKRFRRAKAGDSSSSVSAAPPSSALAAVVPLDVDAAEHPDAELLRMLARFGHLEKIIWPAGRTRCRI